MTRMFIVVAIYAATKQELDREEMLIELDSPDECEDSSDIDSAQRRLDSAKWLGRAFSSIAVEGAAAERNVDRLFRMRGVELVFRKSLELDEEDMISFFPEGESVPREAGLVAPLDPLFLMPDLNEGSRNKLLKFCHDLYQKEV